MQVDISSMSFKCRTELASEGIQIPLGHIHQLVSSALGFKSLAAYQAFDAHEGDASALSSCIDEPGVVERVHSLGITSNSLPAILAALRKHWPHVAPTRGSPVSKGLGERVNWRKTSDGRYEAGSELKTVWYPESRLQPIDPSAGYSFRTQDQQFEIRGREGLWVPGTVMGALANGSAGSSLQIHVSEPGFVSGWSQFPERGDFQFQDSLHALATLIHLNGYYGAMSELRMTFQHD